MVLRELSGPREGTLPVCFDNGFSANKPPASTFPAEEWRRKQLYHQKLCHLLSRDGYPRAAPTPYPHPGRDAYAYGRTPQCVIRTWVEGTDILKHPLLEPSAATRPLPRVRVVEADQCSRPKAQNYLCPSQDLPLKQLLLKIRIKQPCFLPSFPFSRETTRGFFYSAWRQSLTGEKVVSPVRVYEWPLSHQGRAANSQACESRLHLGCPERCSLAPELRAPARPGSQGDCAIRRILVTFWALPLNFRRIVSASTKFSNAKPLPLLLIFSPTFTPA